MSPWIIVGIIVGGILLLYGLLLVVRARVTIEYRDEFSLTLWLFGIPIRILPRKERKKKYRLGRYTLRKIKKREARAARIAEKRRLKKLKQEQERKKKKSEPEKEKDESKFRLSDLLGILKKLVDATPSVTDLIPLLCHVIKLFSSRLFGRLHIKVARLHIRVGASDAMQTAVVFGVVNQSVQYLVALLKKICRMDGLRRADIQVYPDFLIEDTKVDLKITFGISLGAVLLAFLKAGWYLLRGYLRIRPTASNPKGSILPPLPPLPHFPAPPPMPDAPDERD